MSQAPLSPEPSRQALERHTRVNPWLIAASVVLATFMEVLDTTIVVVALPHIAGSMAATNSEATWTLTSYLVANGVIVPMSGWLALKFGRKRLIMLCTLLFVVSSALCGLAPNLTVLIIARVFQGIGGGAMVPVAQAVLLEAFPPEKRGMSMALFGLVVVLAPIIGPTFGGWLTDNYSWRWAFYINVPIGLLSLLLMALFLEDPPWIRSGHAGALDRWGFAFLVLWVGALQVVLDKGQDEDWFSSRLIRRLTVLTILALAAFLVREWRVREPFVDLRVFANRNFWSGTFTMAVVSAVMYSGAALLPQFVQLLLGYTAELSGWTIVPRGLGAFLGLPLAGWLVSFVDGRKLVLAGLALVGLTNFWLGSVLTLETAMRHFFLPNLLQGLGMGFAMVPLMTLAVGTLRNEQMGNASGLFNLARNLGGSIGLSVSTTWLVRGAQRHQAFLVARLTPYDLAYQQSLAGFHAALTPLAGAPQAGRLAHGVLYAVVLQQATLLAYADLYRWLALGVLLCVPGVLAMRRVLARRALPTH